MYALQDWKLNPFLVLGTDPAGLVAGVAGVANGIVFSQSATYNVIRVLSVSHTLSLRQSEYYVEGVSNVLALVDGATWGNERPVSASSVLGILDGVSVSGGQHDIQTILEITANGVILAGQAIYIKNTGYAAAADADVSDTESSVAGVAVADGGGVVSGTLYYRTDGHLILGDWTSATGSASLTPGAPYYLSTTAGLITATAPTGDGEWVVKIGRAVDTKTLAIELGEGVGL